MRTSIAAVLVIVGGSLGAADAGSEPPKPKNDGVGFADAWVANLKASGPLQLVYRHRSPAAREALKKDTVVLAFATKGEDYVLWRGFIDDPKLWVANARSDGKFYTIEHIGDHHAFVYNTNLVKGWSKDRIPPRYSTSSDLVIKNPCLIPLRFLMLGVKDQAGGYGISSVGEIRWSDLFIPGYAGFSGRYFSPEKDGTSFNLEFKDVAGARYVPSPESEKGQQSAELPRAKIKMDAVEVGGKKIAVIASAEVEMPWYQRDMPFAHSDEENDFRINMMFTYKVVGTAVVPAEIKFAGPAPYLDDVGGYVLSGTSFAGQTGLGPMVDKPIPALINALLEEVPRVLDAATGMALD